MDVVKRVLRDVRLSAISARVIEGFQAKRRVAGASNRTVNMGVGVLLEVLKRFKQWRRLEDDVKMLTESGGEPVGRVLTPKNSNGCSRQPRPIRSRNTFTAPESSRPIRQCPGWR